MFELVAMHCSVAEPPASTAVDRVDRIHALERQVARLQAEQAEQIAAHAAESVGIGAERGVAAEVALARGVSLAAAEHQVHAARTVVRDFPLLLDLGWGTEPG